MSVEGHHEAEVGSPRVPNREVEERSRAEHPDVAGFGSIEPTSLGQIRVDFSLRSGVGGCR